MKSTALTILRNYILFFFRDMAMPLYVVERWALSRLVDLLNHLYFCFDLF